LLNEVERPGLNRMIAHLIEFHASLGIGRDAVQAIRSTSYVERGRPRLSHVAVNISNGLNCQNAHRQKSPNLFGAKLNVPTVC
jgi:hypothetical protein